MSTTKFPMLLGAVLVFLLGGGSRPGVGPSGPRSRSAS
jgi:hypothetical protein